MAINTRQKRFSIMNLNRFPPTNLFEADGNIDADDKMHLLALYSGFVSTLTPCAEALTALIQSRGVGINSLINATLGISGPISATMALTTSISTTKGVNASITNNSKGVDSPICE